MTISQRPSNSLIKMTTLVLLTKKLPLLLLNASFLIILCVAPTLELHYNNRHTNALLSSSFSPSPGDGCAGLHDHPDKCFYVETHSACNPKGYINYLRIFYCRLGQSLLLAHSLLLLWLLILFYLLANTASQYFCPSLESLSKSLNLSPTIAGITLLSLGNGAPDVFASIIAFTRSGDASFGLNSVLGGAFFVSSVVIGVISIAISHSSDAMTAVRLDKASFVRDVAFFLLALLSLLAILVARRINLFGAIAFFAIYFLYICSVSATHFLCLVNDEDDVKSDFDLHTIPLLKSDPTLNDDDEDDNDKRMILLEKALRCLELPLYLPRRLTIPMVTEEQWSKPFAVLSVTLAPTLLAFLCNTQRANVDSRTALVTYMSSVLVGMVLGNLAYVTTTNREPPRQCLFPWLVVGFVMSVTWTYILAEELVSLLFALGNVFGVSASVLGVTVLAWGNSIGDLIANVALAVRGGPEGVQVAVSGCYAGPVFNTVVGLGFSLVLSAWNEYPSGYEVVLPSGAYPVYETVGFLAGGLLWALVVLPNANMKLDWLLGIGLLAIYSCFLVVRLSGIFG